MYGVTVDQYAFATCGALAYATEHHVVGIQVTISETIGVGWGRNMIGYLGASVVELTTLEYPGSFWYG